MSNNDKFHKLVEIDDWRVGSCAFPDSRPLLPDEIIHFNRFIRRSLWLRIRIWFLDIIEGFKTSLTPVTNADRARVMDEYMEEEGIYRILNWDDYPHRDWKREDVRADIERLLNELDGDN